MAIILLLALATCQPIRQHHGNSLHTGADITVCCTSMSGGRDSSESSIYSQVALRKILSCSCSLTAAQQTPQTSPFTFRVGCILESGGATTELAKTQISTAYLSRDSVPAKELPQKDRNNRLKKRTTVVTFFPAHEVVRLGRGARGVT
ncbi:hypothetical protein F4824DRAFT_400256 [Ustulina deusta]|nr:hypothetical protein F4824DRAFT_400256 [Ustulina deusta]